MNAAGLLLIRADATPTIGMGHLMRCVALGQGWQDVGGIVRIACAQYLAEPLGSRLQAENIDYDVLSTEPGSADDARKTISLAKQHNAEWIVVDGYQFGGQY